MTMFTRCTHCEAIFRVTLEQLQSSSGQVRCGVCEQVFDAFVALSANDPQSLREPDTLQEVDVPLPAEPGEMETIEAGPQVLDLDLSAPDEPKVADLARPRSESPGKVPGAPRVGAERHDAPDLVFDPTVGARPVGRSSSWWTIGAGLLGVVLLVQGVFVFRTAIASSWPDARPLLEAACVPIGCDVPLPRLSDRLTIEASDLQALDPTRPNRVVLSATIRNRADLMQAWPMLELTLTNAREQVAARKVFTPDQYLDGGVSAPGIAANAEAAVRLRLDTGDIVAAGYRIYLFHP